MSVTITVSEERARQIIDNHKWLSILTNDELAGILSQLTSSFDRQTVLQEKWKPEVSCKDWWSIDTNNIIRHHENFFGEFYNFSYIVFAPTEELAKEIVKVRKGEWLPKKGDEVFYFTKYRILGYTQKAAFDYSKCTEIYFPSEEQRTRFLASQPKPDAAEDKTIADLRDYVLAGKGTPIFEFVVLKAIESVSGRLSALENERKG